MLLQVLSLPKTGNQHFDTHSTKDIGLESVPAGAAAGAAAVIASMPLDVVKTRMEVAPLLVPRRSPCFGGLRAFTATGRALVAARGPGALFSGLAPRLAAKVPGSVVYWLVVAACRRALEAGVEAGAEADLASAPA